MIFVFFCGQLFFLCSAFPAGSELRVQFFAAFWASPWRSLSLRRLPFLFDLQRFALARVILNPQFREGFDLGNSSRQRGRNLIIDKTGNACRFEHLLQFAHGDQVCRCEDAFHDGSVVVSICLREQKRKGRDERVYPEFPLPSFQRINAVWG